MWCPDCGDEFRDGVTSCPDCGVALVSDEAVPRAPEERRDAPAGFVLLASDWDAEASDLIDWLDEEAIPVTRTSGSEDGLEDLHVPQEYLERAQAMLADYYEDEDDDGDDEGVSFSVEDLSERSRELLDEGDIDTFGFFIDGPEADMLALADGFEDQGIAVLVVETDDDLLELHIPDRSRERAASVVDSAGGDPATEDDAESADED